MPEKLMDLRFRKDVKETGTFPANMLSARLSFSRLGKYFKKFKLPENLFPERSRIRRRIIHDKPGGISPERWLFARFRTSSFFNSRIWGGILSISWLFGKESSLSSVSLQMAGAILPFRRSESKTMRVILRVQELLTARDSQNIPAEEQGFFAEERRNPRFLCTSKMAE